MKLYELTGIKSLNSLSVPDLIRNFILNTNYLYASNGTHAYVFIHPNNKEIIKFWIYDEAYEHFIDYIKSHSDNEFLPKIYKGINKISLKDKTIKYVRMEKLKELSKTNVIFGVNFYQLVHILYKQVEKLGISRALSYFDSGKFQNIIQNAIDMTAESESPNVDQIIKFYNTYFDIIKQTKHIPDLNSSNVMLRGKTPVIIDPTNDIESTFLSYNKLGIYS